MTGAPEARLVAARAVVHDARDARRRGDKPRAEDDDETEAVPNKKKKLSRSTLVAYRGNSSRLIKELRRTQGEDLTEAIDRVFGRYCGGSQTFFAYRAAVLWGLRQLRDGLLKRQDDAWAAGNEKLFYRAVARLGHVSEAIAHLVQIDRMELVEKFDPPPRERNSIKKSLKLLPLDWREKLMEVFLLDSRKRQIVEILRITGCRPKEIRNGIVISKEEGAFRVTIMGAKVGDQSGQSLRSFDLVEMPGPLLDQMNKAGLIFTATKAEMDQVRMEMVRESRKLWPILAEHKQCVTPYWFRHQIAQDLADAGWPPLALSGVLGHINTDTARWYCRRRGTTNVGPAAVSIIQESVTTDRPVKEGKSVGFTDEKMMERQQAADARKQARRRPGT